MRKYIVLMGLCFMLKISPAQYSLIFCEDLTNDGKPLRVSNQFMVDGGGGVMKFLVRTEDDFKTEKLDFRIYYMSDAGAEEEIVRLPQPVQPDWNFAWKEIVMIDPGLYRVKIYTDKGTYLTSANVTIKHG